MTERYDTRDKDYTTVSQTGHKVFTQTVQPKETDCLRMWEVTGRARKKIPYTPNNPIQPRWLDVFLAGKLESWKVGKVAGKVIGKCVRIGL